MNKTPEEIQKELINKFGIEIDLNQCSSFQKAYSFLLRTATINSVRIVNQELLLDKVGIEEDFNNALKNQEKIDNKSIKSFYFRNYVFDKTSEIQSNLNENAVENSNEPQPEMSENKLSPKKLKAIHKLSKQLGLSLKDKEFDIFEDKTLEDLSNMTLSQFVKYIVEDKMYAFKLNNHKTFMEQLKHILPEYRKKFVENFLDEIYGEKNTLRGNKEEDEFLKLLASVGLYVLNVDKKSISPIIDLKSLEEALKADVKARTIVTSEDIDLKLLQKENINKLIKKLETEINAEREAKDIDMDELLDLDIPDPLLDFETPTTPLEPNNPSEGSAAPVREAPIVEPASEPASEPTPDPAPIPPTETLTEITSLHGRDIQKDKVAVEELLKNTYVGYGKDAVIKAFDQYNQKGSILAVTLTSEKHNFENKIGALEALNAQYIDYVLMNSEKVEYNYDLNPKARRLGEAIIAMYSNLKTQGKTQDEIKEQINDALTNMIVNSTKDGFNLGIASSEPINNFATNKVIPADELKSRVAELKYLSPNDVIDIMVSSQIDKMVEAGEITKPPLEKAIENFKRANELKEISVDRQIKSNVVQGKDNVSAADTNLLTRVINNEDAKIDKKAPTWEKHRLAREYVMTKINSYINIKNEIQACKEELTNKRIAKEPTKELEEKLSELLNKFQTIMAQESKEQVIFEYIAINNASKQLKFSLDRQRNSEKRKGDDVQRNENEH